LRLDEPDPVPHLLQCARPVMSGAAYHLLSTGK
jgi:hypothetical protein